MGGLEGREEEEEEEARTTFFLLDDFSFGPVHSGSSESSSVSRISLVLEEGETYSLSASLDDECFLFFFELCVFFFGTSVSSEMMMTLSSEGVVPVTSL